MGVVESIGYDNFPKHGKYLGLSVRVSFSYMARTVNGKIVRDDMEHPFVTIIALEDGRYVLSTECQYSPIWKD